MQVSYGGIDFPIRYTQTLRYDEAAVMDDDNVTYRHTNYQLRIQTVLTSQELASSMVALGAIGSPGQMLAQLRTILEAPRQQLVVKDDDGALLILSPAGGTVMDATGGPFTKVAVRYFSPGCWLIEFEVETNLMQCDGTAPDVVSNRWETSVTYDQNEYATRSVTGTLRINKQNDANPDLFRNLVVPPLPKGFIREEFNFQVETSGMALRYSFRDRQVYEVPPTLQDGTKATKAEGTYSVITGDGVLFFGEFRLHLEAPPNVQMSRLFQQALLTALSYVGRNGGIEPGTLRSCAFSRDLYHNAIDFTCRVAKTDYNGNLSDFGVADSHLLVRPPGSESGVAADPGTHGAWLATQMHARLVAPCTGTTPKAGVSSGSNYPSGSDQTGYQPPVTGSSYIDTRQPMWSASHLTTGQHYNSYEVDTFYVQHLMNMVLPTAGAQAFPFTGLAHTNLFC